MPRVKFCVVTKGDWSSGFKLAGVETIEAQNPEEALQILQPFMERNEPALIAIEEDLFPVNDKKLQKHLEEKPFPVVLPLPKIEAKSKEEQEKYVSNLVRSCIGFYVKLK